jgi:hypothetical protein
LLIRVASTLDLKTPSIKRSGSISKLFYRALFILIQHPDMEFLLLSSAFSLSTSKFQTDSTQNLLKGCSRLRVHLSNSSVHVPAGILPLNNLPSSVSVFLLEASFKPTNATVKHIYPARNKSSSLLYGSSPQMKSTQIPWDFLIPSAVPPSRLGIYLRSEMGIGCQVHSRC